MAAMHRTARRQARRAAVAATATATVYRGYADEFVGHRVACLLTENTQGPLDSCLAQSLYGPVGQWPGWEHVG